MSQVVQAVVPFGKYDLVASLGRGGMAEIFLANERGRDSLVVIKRVLPHLTTELRFLEMLVSEAKVASLLNHPGIVRILDLGQEQGQFYLAMEYVPGWNVLAVTKAAGGRVPPPIAAAIGVQVAEALSHAHLQTDLGGRPLNLVHRDVTPGNVMVTPAGDAKLIDFGIAKAATQLTKTAPGILKGKLRFVSPEQVRQEPVDARSDLFSLGVSLYEITTGTQPFGFTHAAQTLQAILDFEPPRPRTIVPDFPEDLEEIILKSLEKHPDDRYPGAKEMADALAGALAADPHSDLGAWLTELASRKCELLPPPRNPLAETVPVRPPPRAGTRDKVPVSKVTGETVRLPNLKDDEAARPAKKPELAQTRPMSRDEIARHVDDAAPAAGAPLPPPPRTRTAEKRAGEAVPGAVPRARTSEKRAVEAVPDAAPRTRTAEKRAAEAVPGAVPRSKTSEKRAVEAIPDAAPRTRTAEKRAAEAPGTPSRPRTSDRSPAAPAPSALRSRSSDRAPAARPVEPPAQDLLDRMTPTAAATAATTNLGPPIPEPDAALLDRMTPTAMATDPDGNARPLPSAAALAMLPPEDLPTTATDPEAVPPPGARPAAHAEPEPKPRPRTQDKRPAAAAPRPSGTQHRSRGRLPQWLVGFLLGLVGVLGVGAVGGAIYWLAVLRK